MAFNDEELSAILTIAKKLYGYNKNLPIEQKKEIKEKAIEEYLKGKAWEKRNDKD